MERQDKRSAVQLGVATSQGEYDNKDETYWVEHSFKWQEELSVTKGFVEELRFGWPGQNTGQEGKQGKNFRWERMEAVRNPAAADLGTLQDCGL